MSNTSSVRAVFSEDKTTRTNVKLTKKVKRFIVEKLSEGYTIADICRMWPKDVPIKPNTIYKASMYDESVAEMLDTGYTLWYYRKQEELCELSLAIPSEMYPHISPNEAGKVLDRRINALNFLLARMSSVMSKRFNRAAKVEVSGDNLAPTINVVKYYATPLQPPLNSVSYDDTTDL